MGWLLEEYKGSWKVFILNIHRNNPIERKLIEDVEKRWKKIKLCKKELLKK